MMQVADKAVKIIKQQIYSATMSFRGLLKDKLNMLETIEVNRAENFEKASFDDIRHVATTIYDVEAQFNTVLGGCYQKRDRLVLIGASSDDVLHGFKRMCLDDIHAMKSSLVRLIVISGDGDGD